MQEEATGETGRPQEECKEGARIEKEEEHVGDVAAAAKLQFESAGNDGPGMSSPLDEQAEKAPCVEKHRQDVPALPEVAVEAESSSTTIPGNADGEMEESAKGARDVEALSGKVGDSTSLLEVQKCTPAVQCSKCAQPFCPTANKPMLLPCLHSFCAGCVSAPRPQGAGTTGAMGAGGTAQNFWCPLCEKLFPHAMENQALAASVAASLFAQHGKALCGDCGNEAGRDDGVYCRECCLFLCSLCAAHHRRALLTKQHSMRTIEDMQGLVRSDASRSGSFLLGDKSFCPTHPTCENDFYCTHCARVVCQKCAITHHDNHQRLPIAESAESFKTTELEGWQRAVQGHHSRLEQAEAHLATQVPSPHPAPRTLHPAPLGRQAFH